MSYPTALRLKARRAALQLRAEVVVSKASALEAEALRRRAVRRARVLSVVGLVVGAGLALAGVWLLKG